jgi:hypothetical protein
MALTYQNRRVRCQIEEPDDLDRLIAEVGVLTAAQPDLINGVRDDDGSEE